MGYICPISQNVHDMQWIKERRAEILIAGREVKVIETELMKTQNDGSSSIMIETHMVKRNMKPAIKGTEKNVQGRLDS